MNKALFKYIRYISIKSVAVLSIAAINLFCTKVSGQITSDTIGLIDEKTLASVPFIEHSPQKATLYSAILPGLGQIYNKQAWKVVIIYAALGVSGYYIYHNNDMYNMYRAEYFRIVSYKETHNNSLDEDFHFQIDEAQKYADKYGYSSTETAIVSNMDKYHKWRDLSVICTAAIYGLNIIEANVSAHFFSYDISEDLSMNIEPVLINTQLTSNTPGLRISFSF